MNAEYVVSKWQFFCHDGWLKEQENITSFKSTNKQNTKKVDKGICLTQNSDTVTEPDLTSVSHIR